jgi:cytochrome c oxidase subunit 2
VAVGGLAIAWFAVGSAWQAATPRVISIEAERFNFSPSRIKVEPGEEIEIRLRSADTAHGFRIEGSEIDVEIPKRGRGEVVVRYKSPDAGRVKFECNRMCGAGHDFMRGEIVVEKKER